MPQPSATGVIPQLSEHLVALHLPQQHTKITISYSIQGTLLAYSSRQLKSYHLTHKETDFPHISHLNNKSIDLRQFRALHLVTKYYSWKVTLQH